MRINKLLAVTLIVAMSVTMLAGCGTKDSSNSNAYPGTTEENAISVNIVSEPPEMFTVTTTDTISFSVIRHVIDNLVMLDANDEVIPAVAKDWTISEDELVYTFNLRDDMKWSNGEKVTAEDFVFAWTALLTPDFAADYAYFGYILKNGLAYNNGEVGKEEVGVKALSEFVLEVTLENPTPYALDTFAFGVFAPVNEKAYNEFGTAYGTDYDKMVYNGAFNMTAWDHESQIVLEKNADYYNADKIELDKITMLMITDINASMNSFKAGEVDLITINGDQSDMMETEKYPYTTYDDGSVFYLELNTLDKYLGNANLRKALNLAIDSQSYVDSIIKNSSQAATSFTAPGINGLKDKFAKEVGKLIPTFDLAKAKEFYATALEELGVDAVELTMISDDTDAAVDTAAFVQEQLKVNLGIDLKVESMPFKSRLERTSNKDFSIVFAGWGPDYNDPMTFLDMFETGNGNNHTSYTNTAYDELLSKVRTELDPTTRFGYLTELETLLMEDLPIAPVYWRSRDYVTSGKIASGVIRTAFQDMNFRNVKLAK